MLSEEKSSALGIKATIKNGKHIAQNNKVNRWLYKILRGMPVVDRVEVSVEFLFFLRSHKSKRFLKFPVSRVTK